MLNTQAMMKRGSHWIETARPTGIYQPTWPGDVLAIIEDQTRRIVLLAPSLATLIECE